MSDWCPLSRRCLCLLCAFTALPLRSLLDRRPRRSHGDGMNRFKIVTEVTALMALSVRCLRAPIAISPRSLLAPNSRRERAGRHAARCRQHDARVKPLSHILNPPPTTGCYSVAFDTFGWSGRTANLAEHQPTTAELAPDLLLTIMIGRSSAAFKGAKFGCERGLKLRDEFCARAKIDGVSTSETQQEDFAVQVYGLYAGSCGEAAECSTRKQEGPERKIAVAGALLHQSGGRRTPVGPYGRPGTTRVAIRDDLHACLSLLVMTAVLLVGTQAALPAIRALSFVYPFKSLIFEINRSLAYTSNLSICTKDEERIPPQTCSAPLTYACISATCEGIGPPYNNGATCTYQCVSPCTGTTTTVTCNNGVWDGQVPFCQQLSSGCRTDPPSYTDYCVTTTCESRGPPYNEGDTCTYQCNSTCTGGATTVTCTNGQWDGPVPFCQQRDGCPSPPEFDCATMSGCSAPYAEGAICSYRCNDTCAGEPGTMTRTCENGRWVGDDWRGCFPILRLGCDAFPPTFPCTSRTCTGTGTDHGDVCTYVCDRGCTGTPSTMIRTCEDGDWVGPDWRGCEPLCSTPPHIDCTTISGCEAPYTNGEVCNYRCNDTCAGSPSTTYRVCRNGTWDECPDPPDFDCTTRSGCSAPYTDLETCTYTCNDTCVGNPSTMTRTCRGGRWYGEDWRGCSETCPDPPEFHCTTRNGCSAPYTDLETCTYTCNDTCVGNPNTMTRTCRGGRWYGEDWRGCSETCPDPPEFHCTTRNGCSAPYTDLETCTYTCNDTCVGNPNTMTRTCRGGRWYGEDWRGCSEKCPDPPEIDCTTRSGCSAPYTDLETCTYTCNDTCVGNPSTMTRTCRGGRWYGEDWRGCSETCPDPPEFHCTTRNGCSAPYTDLETCTYTCNDTCVGNPSTMTRTCRGGRWYGEDWRGCSEKCPDPPEFDCTIMSGCSAPYISGEICTYKCNNTCVGNPSIMERTCREGRWHGPDWAGCSPRRVCDSAPPAPPTCVEVICGPQQPPYPDGYTCGYTCARNCTGYYSTLVTCRDGYWFGAPPECKLGVVNGPLYCREPAPEFDCATRTGCSSPYTDGETCTYTCNDTCTATPSIMTRTCRQGIWTGEPWKGCHGDCGNPPSCGWCTIRTGCIAPYYHGEVCHYECNRERGCYGFPAATTRTCIDGTWVGQPWGGCWRR
ncbi:hypothetical protein Bbelb_224080, partial [Branchiostoma belcheri]